MKVPRAHRTDRAYWRCLVAAASLLFVTAAQGQSNLDAGKSPAQIFSDTCNACHRNPREVRRTSPAFLREHYTTGTREAAAMAAYLASVGSDARAVQQRKPPVLRAGRTPAAENSGTKPAAAQAGSETATGAVSAAVHGQAQKAPRRNKPLSDRQSFVVRPTAWKLAYPLSRPPSHAGASSRYFRLLRNRPRKPKGICPLLARSGLRFHVHAVLRALGLKERLCRALFGCFCSFLISQSRDVLAARYSSRLIGIARHGELHCCPPLPGAGLCRHPCRPMLLIGVCSAI